jgi:hypothetical protein
MTFPIFDTTGNLVDAFDDRDAAGAALPDIVRAEPEAADEVFLVAQGDEGHLGETIYGSSLHVTLRALPNTQPDCCGSAEPRR